MSESASTSQHLTVPAADDSDSATDGARRVDTVPERQPVSVLVRNYGDPLNEANKRDRSESGDSVPAGKRGAREPSRSPSTLSGRSLKESLDSAVEGLESRLMVSLSRELHEFRETLSAEIVRLSERVKDLEQHVEERDGVISQLNKELRQSKEEVSALQVRVEDAEINSRLPCLVLSGAAMAPRHAPRLEPPLPARAASEAGARPGSAEPAGQGQVRAAVTSRPADRAGGEPGRQSAAAARGARLGGATRVGD